MLEHTIDTTNTTEFEIDHSQLNENLNNENSNDENVVDNNQQENSNFVIIDNSNDTEPVITQQNEITTNNNNTEPVIFKKDEMKLIANQPISEETKRDRDAKCQEFAKKHMEQLKCRFSHLRNNMNCLQIDDLLRISNMDPGYRNRELSNDSSSNKWMTTFQGFLKDILEESHKKAEQMSKDNIELSSNEIDEIIYKFQNEKARELVGKFDGHLHSFFASFQWDCEYKRLSFDDLTNLSLIKFDRDLSFEMESFLREMREFVESVLNDTNESNPTPEQVDAKLNEFKEDSVSNVIHTLKNNIHNLTLDNVKSLNDILQQTGSNNIVFKATQSNIEENSALFVPPKSTPITLLSQNKEPKEPKEIKKTEIKTNNYSVKKLKKIEQKNNCMYCVCKTGLKCVHCVNQTKSVDEQQETTRKSNIEIGLSGARENKDVKVVSNFMSYELTNDDELEVPYEVSPYTKKVITKKSESEPTTQNESQNVKEDNTKKEKHPQLDSVVSSVIESFKERSELGQKKYGKNLDRNDLGLLDWIRHAQEEHMDAILYLEKIKQMMSGKNKNNFSV
jgi:hypothetical protein